ncbi:MAG: 3-deoxy-manno-octulosonate cytidylyltransferase, partial [Kiritimatiellia bacterium]|nr:3-deoxy-manno-octulosonate cytidylyltransferase [Kiritimatiellia bacterium]
IYAYRRAFLKRIVSSPPTALEETAKLEQLRALALGARMVVIETDHIGIGVDTPEDVAKVEALMKQG